MNSRLLPYFRREWGLSLIVLLIAIVACNLPSSSRLSPATTTHTSTLTFTASFTPSFTPSPSETSTATSTPVPTATITNSQTHTLTLTDTPIPTDTPTITLTSTLQNATVEADGNINCRWGPNTVYLVAGLFREGSIAQVDGRDYGGNWLWIQMEGFSYHCWVATSAVIVSGDLDSVSYGPLDPPINSSIAPATGVGSVRDGDSVIVVWSAAASAVDLHYLIKANICNGQFVIEWTDVTTKTSYILQDPSGCSGNSSAKLFVVNKLGYSSPVPIPWP